MSGAAPQVVWHSYFPPMGYGVAAQTCVEALREAEGGRARWVAHDFSSDRHAVLLDEIDRIDLNVLHLTPGRMPPLMRAQVPNLACTVFETDRLPAHWREPLQAMDRIAVPSTWNQQVFARELGREIDWLPHRSEFHGRAPAGEPEAAERDPLVAIPAEAFVFLTVASWEPRKNIEGLIEAYLDAFPNERDVLLVVKTGRASFYLPRMRELALPRRETSETALARLVRGKPQAPRILLLTEALPANAMQRLYARADAYVTLSRGEGWGYGAFESAWFGKPVIATGYGGHLDYLPPDRSFLVDYRITDYQKNLRQRDRLDGHRYADPVRDDAIDKLRFVYRERGAAAERGARLREFVAEQFSDNRHREHLLRFLHAGLAEGRRVPLGERLARRGKPLPNAEEKHFHETGLGLHYDHRFFVRDVALAERTPLLLELLDAFVRMADAAGVRPILMHGALIGWAWNGRMLPWDRDIDLSLLIEDLQHLWRSDAELDYDRTRFLLDVNPHCVERTTRNRSPLDQAEPNRIDARFIDRTTGLYLDITALAPEGPEQLATKCPHRYERAEILPLERAVFAGTPLFVPHDVPAVLAREYGPSVLTNPRHYGYRFDPKRREWFEPAWRRAARRLRDRWLQLQQALAARIRARMAARAR